VLNLQTTTQYRRDRRLMIKRRLPMHLLDQVLQTLVEEKPLGAKHRDHPLTGEYTGFRECHKT
jgi:mRNA interferase YafQ